MKVCTGLLVLLGLCVTATAQETPDMLGDWTFTVSGLDAHPSCGELQQAGILQIERKIAARAYRGSVRTEETFEKCQGTKVAESAATIRVRDSLITIEYDEEGWRLDRLSLVDGVMTGKAGDGVSTHWKRVVTTDDAGDAPTAEQLADLELFLGRVAPEVSEQLDETYAETLTKGLRRTGLSIAESGQIAEQTIERMTTCMLEVIRQSVIAKEIQIEKILKSDAAVVMVDPQASEFIGGECVQAAAWNAGVRIR